MPITLTLRAIAVSALMALAGCGVGAPGAHLDPVEEVEITALASQIRSLGPNVSDEEARRAARIALTYPQELAVSYGVTDSPIIHNMKVNMGMRPRGLCWHWAEDMENRLREENFRTLTLHRAIANAFDRLDMDHSTVIISARGDAMEDGVILDPWRFGGELYWGPVPDDPDFVWQDRREVFAVLIAEMEAAGIEVPVQGARAN